MVTSRIPEKLRKPSNNLLPRPNTGPGVGIPIKPFATITVDPETGAWNMRSNATPLMGLQLAHMLESHFLKMLNDEAEKSNAEMQAILMAAQQQADRMNGQPENSPEPEMREVWHGEYEEVPQSEEVPQRDEMAHAAGDESVATNDQMLDYLRKKQAEPA